MSESLTAEIQRQVVATVFAVVPGFYTPRTRWGRPMSVRMLCMGRHWSARDYRYHPARVDVDGLPCPAIPPLLAELPGRLAVNAGYLSPAEVLPWDICIANFYPDAGAKLGDHVDNSESPETLRSGYPVVSISIGSTCVFRFGGLARTDPYDKHRLQSGDVVIFGRSVRLAYHGVARVIPGTSPNELGLPEPGRLNLTFRRF
jgi:alkylated DNA repair protein (DNA oxidative demethylase)